MRTRIERPAAVAAPMIRSARVFLNLLLPPRCPLCGEGEKSASGVPLCEKCISSLRRVEGPRCPTCGRLLPEPSLLEMNPRFRCGECRPGPPLLDAVQTLFLFQGALREAVHLFKYSGYWKLGRGLIDFRLKELLPALTEVEGVLPVPLHSSRLRNRGFNQATVLARAVSEGLSVPLLLGQLVRLKGGRPQVGLHPKERRRNIRGCFTVLSGEAIRGRHLLIVDDVLTTGATAQECARTLKNAGAETVRFLALAGAFME
ncbi:MAG: ComF family protein [Deltaproteobacteria bacterium]|nr:ComF family protein [Deltaproteobacteria bacterium]